MARKFLTAIDLTKLELQNAAIHNLAAAPSSPVKGQLYFDTVSNVLYWWNGTVWVAAQGGAGLAPAATVTTQAVGDAAVVGVSTAYAREDHKHGREAFGAITAETTFGTAAGNGAAVTLARSDHTHGNPVHNAAAHSTIPLNTFAAPTGDVSMGGFKITGLGTPVAATDAANKGYVDNSIAGLSWKEAVRAASTAAIAHPPTGLLTLDTNVVLVAGDRVLLKNQASNINNGIWVAAAGAWTRATDADGPGELEGAAVLVMEGATLNDTAWVQSYDPSPINPGTDPNMWVQFAGNGFVVAGTGMTQSGSTLNVIGDTSITVTADQISRAALTGDVTAAAGANATTIANDAVTNVKLANMANYTFKGRVTAGAGDPEDIDTATMQIMLDILRPAQAAGTYTTRVAVDCAANVLTTVTHNFNTRDVAVTVYRNSTPWDNVECDIERSTVNTVEVRFATAPTAGQYRIVVVGIDQ